MVDLTDFRDEVFKSLQAQYKCKIARPTQYFEQPRNPEGYECKFSFLLKEKTISSDTNLNLLCHHEEECGIMSRLIKKFKKENNGLALILTLKMEKYKNNKLPKGQLKI